MDLSSKAKEFLKERPRRMRINQEIKQMAKAVARAAPEVDDAKTVVSFNASTRITGLSVNAAFAMLTGWSLRLQGVRAVSYTHLTLPTKRIV